MSVFLSSYKDSMDKDILIKILYKTSSNRDIVRSIDLYYIFDIFADYPDFNYYIELCIIGENVPLYITFTDFIDNLDIDAMNSNFIKQLTFNFSNCILNYKGIDSSYDGTEYKFNIKTDNCIINIWDNIYKFSDEINDLKSSTLTIRDLTMQDVLDFYTDGKCYHENVLEVSPHSYHIMAENSQVYIVKDMYKEYFSENFKGEFVFRATPKENIKDTYFDSSSIFALPTELNMDTPYIKCTKSIKTLEVNLPIHDVKNMSNHLYLLYIAFCNAIDLYIDGKNFGTAAHGILSQAEKLNDDVLYYPLDFNMQRYIDVYKNVNFSSEAKKKYSDYNIKIRIVGNGLEELNESDLDDFLTYFKDSHKLEIIFEDLIFKGNPNSQDMRYYGIYFYNCRCKLYLYEEPVSSIYSHMWFYNTDTIVYLEKVSKFTFIDDMSFDGAVHMLYITLHKEENSCLMFLCKDKNMIMSSPLNTTTVECAITYTEDNLYLSSLDILYVPHSIMHSKIINNISYFTTSLLDSTLSTKTDSPTLIKEFIT